MDNLRKLYRVLFDEPGDDVPTHWNGPNGETVTYHRYSDHFTWTLPDGTRGECDWGGAVLSAVGVDPAEVIKPPI